MFGTLIASRPDFNITSSSLMIFTVYLHLFASWAAGQTLTCFVSSEEKCERKKLCAVGVRCTLTNTLDDRRDLNTTPLWIFVPAIFSANMTIATMMMLLVLWLLSTELNISSTPHCSFASRETACLVAVVMSPGSDWWCDRTTGDRQGIHRAQRRSSNIVSVRMHVPQSSTSN